VRHFFLALASSLLITSQSLAWPDSLRPIDQCSGDPSFAKFQDRLKRVVLKKDQKALLNLLAPDVLLDFGGGSGRKAFEERWSFDPHEYGNVWDQLETMLKQHGDWMELGSADEQKPAKEGTVEAWGRSPQNPIGGWYGLKKGLRGRFGMYIPPLMEVLGLAEVEHNAKGNRMRAL